MMKFLSQERYDEFYRKIYSTLKSRLQGRLSLFIEDIHAEAFLELHEKIKKKPDFEPFAYYAFYRKVAVNKAINLYKSNGVKEEKDVIFGMKYLEEAQEPDVHNKVMFHNAFVGLSEICQKVVRRKMHYRRNELSLSEIAEEEGKALSTIKNRRRKCMDDFLKLYVVEKDKIYGS